jgi:GTP-binding protein HflX
VSAVEFKERALIVGLALKGQDAWISEDHLTELALLAETAGAKVVGTVLQKRDKIDSAYYIGRGKCQQLSAQSAELNADLVLFDDDLAPGQVRNLEREIKRRIIDRTGIILDIFAQRARTAEAKIEVELAQLQYLLPRLTRHWIHLSRQAGGIGTRGPGETQLETDRRMVRKRIAILTDKLHDIERIRQTQRKKRSELPVVALVGYTNAGKSTLLNALTDSDAFVEDKLFATLDPLVRSLVDERGRKILVTDTVGFIRKLPHHLVASFHSTLEEVVQSDLLVHIVDISHPFYFEQMEQVRGVLEEIGASARPFIVVFNKVDLVTRDSAMDAARNRYPGAIFISATRKIGLKNLIAEISQRLFTPIVQGEIVLQPSQAIVWDKKFPEVQVDAKEFKEGRILIRFRTDEKHKKPLLEFASEDNVVFYS